MQTTIIIRKIIIGLSLLLFVLFLNCGKDLPELPSLDLEMLEVSFLDSLTLRAEVIVPDPSILPDLKAEDVGFILADSTEQNNIDTIPGRLIGGNKFEGIRSSLGLNQSFRVKAFLKIIDKFDKQKKFLFSTSFPLTTTGIEVSINISEIDARKVLIQTTTEGAFLDSQIKEVGFVWKTGDTINTYQAEHLLLENSKKKFLPKFERSFVQQIEIPEKADSAYLFARSYIIHKEDTIYGNLIAEHIGNFWEEINTLPEDIGCRSEAVSFSDGKYGYIGLGLEHPNCEYQPEDNEIFRNDFWRFNPETGEWAEMAKFPGVARINAEAFVVEEGIFVGLGRTFETVITTDTIFKDFYEFIPGSLNSKGRWEERADFPNARRNTVSFVIGDRAFVGTGKACDPSFCDCTQYLCFQRDFYEFIPDTLAPMGYWKPVDPLPGKDDFELPNARLNAMSFVVNDKGYVCSGLGQDFVGEQKNDAGLLRNNKTDLWEFDPAEPSGKQWTQKEDFPSRPRERGIGLSLSGNGYIALGGIRTIDKKFVDLPTESDFWQYHPSVGWVQLPNIKNIRRWEAVGFGIGKNVYIGLGEIIENNKRIDNRMYRYIPQE